MTCFNSSSIGPPSPLASYTSPSGQVIGMKEMVKDLGVLMSDDRTFKANNEKVIEMAKNISLWILPAFKTH